MKNFVRKNVLNFGKFMDEGKIVKIGNAKEIIKELEEQKVELHFS